MASIYDKASLVLIPSGTKTSKVYSQKPTNGDGDFTFSRSTAATRVNASGNIEKETENLLTQSNNFDSSDWTKVNNSRTSGQSGYDGSSDAWLVTATGAGAKYILQNNASTGVHTFSLYAKKGTTKGIRISINGGGDHWANFNLDLGTQVGTAASVVDTEIVSIGGGWYRISVTANKTASGWGVIYPLDNSFNANYTASGENLYIQDAQLEQGLVARDYIETTTTAIYGGITDNVPRLDYTDSSCPALLLEPQRTNLLPHSEYMTSSNWVGGQTTAAVVLSSNLSPEGKRNCYQVTRSSSTTTQVGTFTGITNGSTYTASIYVKSISGGLSVRLKDVNGISTIKSITTDWTRLDLTSTSTSTIGRVYLELISDGDVVEIYGAQLEAGSYATSYIPTYGSAVTRNVENCEAANAALIGQTEGTLFWEGQELGATDAPYISLYNNSNNRILLYYSGGNVSAQVRVAGVVEFQGGTQGVSGRTKMAVAYKNGSYAFYVDGVQVTTSTGLFSGFVSPQLNKVDLGYSVQDGGRNNQLLVFKTRLSNEELAALTTI